MPGTPAWAQGPRGVAGGAGKEGWGESCGGGGWPSRWTTLVDTGSWMRVDLGLERKAQG